MKSRIIKVAYCEIAIKRIASVEPMLAGVV